jgi:hypothetical protein
MASLGRQPPPHLVGSFFFCSRRYGPEGETRPTKEQIPLGALGALVDDCPTDVEHAA